MGLPVRDADPGDPEDDARGVATRLEPIGRSRTGAAACGEGRHNWLLKLPGNQSLHVQKVECELTLPGLPASLDGLTITQVSDTHFSRCYRREFFEAVAEEAARWEADLVAFTGDLLDDAATIDWVEPVLSPAPGATRPVRDPGQPRPAAPSRPDPAGLAEGRIRRPGRPMDLDRVDGATLALGGTSEPWGPRLDYARCPRPISGSC